MLNKDALHITSKTQTLIHFNKLIQAKQNVLKISMYQFLFRLIYY